MKDFCFGVIWMGWGLWCFEGEHNGVRDFGVNMC